jgi:hypothetical protein
MRHHCLGSVTDLRVKKKRRKKQEDKIEGKKKQMTKIRIILK